MRLLPTLLFLLGMLHWSYAPPVSPDKHKDDDNIKDNLEEYMEYHRYLQEVVQALESDPDFRERLEKADEDDVRSGKIAEQLDFVNHNVRSKLDEIKRRELDRLRHLATKQYELTNNIDTNMGKVATSEHLDHANPHTFEIEDLKRLIKKTTQDLQAADKKREEEFKEYEMHKEFEKHQKLENMDDSAKKEYMEKLKKEEEEKKHHQPLHHPGSKPQLEEVWEKQDHMDQQFDAKAFFMMHDVDGNGAWDADEVKALFVKELDKLYGPGGPNKDLHERAEEMERMREHVFKENDLNRDGLIDFHEFMVKTQNADFNRDEGWKSIDENQIYSQTEYEEYEKRRLEELRYLQQRGLVDAHGRPLPGAEHQIHQAYQQHQAYQHQQAYQMAQQQQFQGGQHYPQGQVPQQGYQQVPPQGYQGQYHPPPPQGQYQAPQGQQQMPQGQHQMPQGQHQMPQGQHQMPQGQHQMPQGQHQMPQGQYPVHQGQNQMNQVQPPQPGQAQSPQGQGQHPESQGQPPQGHGQPPQGQGQLQHAQGQPQQTQGHPQQAQAPPQQVPVQTQDHIQPPQGQMNHGQPDAQIHPNSAQGQPQQMPPHHS